MMNADLVLKSKNIFTSLSDESFPGGVAVKGNRIIAVGPDIDCFIEEQTEVKDYGDKLIMPSFIDAHMHYFQGVIASSDHMCDELIDTHSEEEAVAMMKKFAAEHPDEKRVLGFGWFPTMWNDAPLPTKCSLDEAIPDRPAYLISADFHTLWLNTPGLEEAGITPDREPERGYYGRFENGELNGLLHEPDACAPAMGKVMDFAPEELKHLHKSFMKKINACGVTSISDMSIPTYSDATYHDYSIIRDMDRSGELTCRLHTYTRLSGYKKGDPVLSYKDEFYSEKLRWNGLKDFVDGTTSTYTAYFLEPYSDKPETCGINAPMINYEDAVQSIIDANSDGLSVRLHCIGDAAVHMGLDMYEESARVNGAMSFCNTIEHIEMIDPEDIPRFKEIGNVIPSMQPMHLPIDKDEKVLRCGMKRARWEWAFRSILDVGGQIAFGTDYPVVGFDPFPGIMAAVTRLNPDGSPASVNPEECITLPEALIAYTKSAAHAYNRDDIGVLEEGKLADIIVVDRDLFSTPLLEIGDAKVELTIMDGKIVYEK